MNAGLGVENFIQDATPVIFLFLVTGMQVANSLPLELLVGTRGVILVVCQ
jgi:hypothetical protein